MSWYIDSEGEIRKVGVSDADGTTAKTVGSVVQVCEVPLVGEEPTVLEEYTAYETRDALLVAVSAAGPQP
ncbi:hypothetical protein [Thalassospira xiamenensis]|uniref:Uncharacterized protein n=1 Tax=Thalassospira xiamenensis TaxID=220697 RepID=A0A285THD3_9PROT|nr:hypothetical protein [Thalassospira xiamenensis]SOC21367.1 hypothetical protein SAMN05428964_103386 [Thalassospira xiamenensis]